ncbi:hypothetical protein [Cupriavidus nantongensis]|uniref:hypothetical protein n=1 Tax=Cupriavidus nantongensis TaxID=1796606 RepID=UPI001237859C|nr:hypothetical protein [Cupriavidus nantongensis]
MPRIALETDERRVAGGSIFKHLAIEMLELAAADLARPLPGHQDLTRGAREARLNHKSAKRWISASCGDAATIPFPFCCDALGIDPLVVAGALLADPKGLMEKLRQLSRREELGQRELEHRDGTVLAVSHVAVRHSSR